MSSAIRIGREIALAISEFIIKSLLHNKVVTLLVAMDEGNQIKHIPHLFEVLKN